MVRIIEVNKLSTLTRAPMDLTILELKKGCVLLKLFPM